MKLSDFMFGALCSLVVGCAWAAICHFVELPGSSAFVIGGLLGFISMEVGLFFHAFRRLDKE